MLALFTTEILPEYHAPLIPLGLGYLLPETLVGQGNRVFLILAIFLPQFPFPWLGVRGWSHWGHPELSYFSVIFKFKSKSQNSFLFR